MYIVTHRVRDMWKHAWFTFIRLYINEHDIGTSIVSGRPGLVPFPTECWLGFIDTRFDVAVPTNSTNNRTDQ